MKRFFKSSFFVIIFLLLSTDLLASDEINAILNRHREYLLQAGPDKERPVAAVAAAFNPNTKKWTNIDYGDKERAGWRVSDHLRNIKALAISWNTPGSQWYQDDKIYQIILNGLDDWATHKYQNPNWWHNEIGVPQLMRDILVLMRHQLAADRMNNYLAILRQHRIASDGANLVWSADLGLFYGLFTKNNLLIDSAVKRLTAEIKISDKEGLRPDFSFHQHGPRLQMYQYGAAFLLENIRIAWELQHSRWAYPAEKVALLSDMLLKGWQWMARGIYTVPETMDRSCTRVNELNKADVRTYIDFFIALDPANNAALKALSNRQNNRGKNLNGFRNFPYSDFATAQADGFSFFIKTISTRTLVSESINSENLKGKLLNSGETYFMRDGMEYFNLMPVWNWAKLPGITAFEGAEKIDKKAFNGAVSDGATALLSMDFVMQDKEARQTVSCKKSWIISGDYMLCLMGGLQLQNLQQAYTVLDQSRMRGHVTIDKGPVINGNHELQDVKWIRHQNFVYAPLQNNNKMQLYADTVSGNWYSINRSYSADNIVEKVFMPSLKHSAGTPSTAYLVVNAGKKSSAAVLRRQPFTIVKNDESCQAVVLKNKSLLASFYTAGGIAAAGHSITVNRPCMILVTKNKIYITDPTHQGGKLNFTHQGNQYEMDLRNDGITIEKVL